MTPTTMEFVSVQHNPRTFVLVHEPDAEAGNLVASQHSTRITSERCAAMLLKISKLSALHSSPERIFAAATCVAASAC